MLHIFYKNKKKQEIRSIGLVEILVVGTVGLIEKDTQIWGSEWLMGLHFEIQKIREEAKFKI